MAKRKKQKVEQPEPTQPAAGGSGQQPATVGEPVQPIVGPAGATYERVQKEQEKNEGGDK